MAVGDIYRTSFAMQVNGQQSVNVYYFKQTNANAQNNAQAAADTLTPLLTAAYSGVYASNSTTPQSNVTCQLVSRLASDAGSNIGTLSVGIGGETMPALVAVTMKLKTGLAGKTRRGRVFIGGVAATCVAGSTLSATGISRYGLFATALVTNFCGASPVSGFQLGVFSRTRYAILSNPFDEYFAPVTQIIANGAIASMRSRKYGVGS